MAKLVWIAFFEGSKIPTRVSTKAVILLPKWVSSTWSLVTYLHVSRLNQKTVHLLFLFAESKCGNFLLSYFLFCFIELVSVSRVTWCRKISHIVFGTRQKCAFKVSFWCLGYWILFGIFLPKKALFGYFSFIVTKVDLTSLKVYLLYWIVTYFAWIICFAIGLSSVIMGLTKRGGNFAFFCVICLPKCLK